jgi:hypothetical protein
LLEGVGRVGHGVVGKPVGWCVPVACSHHCPWT